MIRAGFVYDHVLAQHTLGEWHPMKPVRLRLTYDLLESYNAFNDTDSFLVKPRLATGNEIMRFHTREYLDAVRRISCQDVFIDQTEFNFGTGDNPVYEGMYEAASYSTGASMRAAEILASGEVDAAMNISGEGTVSQPPAWCSPTQNSSKPSHSANRICSRSRSKARVGFSRGGCIGIVNRPNRISGIPPEWTWEHIS